MGIGFLLGIWRYQVSIPVIDEHHVAYYRDSGQVVTIEGWIDQKPEEKDQKKQLVVSCQLLVVSGGDVTQVSQLADIKNNPIPVNGHIQVSVSKYEDFFYGDVVQIEESWFLHRFLRLLITKII